ncbi:MAG: hypothetical protein V4456_03395 [Bacteroidota bacterium]
MKTTFYIVLAFLLYGMTGCAQTKFTEGISTVNNQKFDIARSTMVFDGKKPWFIHPSKNKYNGPLPPPKDNYQFPMRRSEIHVDLEKVNTIVYRVLQEKKQALRNKNEKLGVSFKFETNGTLTDVNYTLSEDTIITLAEIEQIDTALRQGIKATFTGPSYTHYIAVDYSFPSISF